MDQRYRRHLERLSPLLPIETGVKPKGAPKGPVKALLFDVYGTLFISAAGDITQWGQDGPGDRSVLQIFQDLGIEGIGPSGVYESLQREIEKEHNKKRAAGIEFPEVEIDRLWQRILKNVPIETAREAALAFETRTNPVYPMPGLKRLLEKIKMKKIAAGVISNAQFYTPLLFEHFTGALPEESWACPDLVVYSYKHGHAKPSPFLFELAAGALAKRKIAAKEALFVGNDMLNDIAPAKRAGFQTALFAGDARSLRLRRDDERCRGISPDMVVTSLERIANII